MSLTKNEVQARIAKMIPGGLLLEFMSYEHIVELMTVTQIITNLCLNEIEERGELTNHANGRVIVPVQCRLCDRNHPDSRRLAAVTKEKLMADHCNHCNFDPSQAVD
jgi:hypothetical protein